LLSFCFRYSLSYFFGFFPLFFMIVPPGILLNLAFATTIGSAENWFILTPDSPFKYLSVYMMILHNVQAWVLWVSDVGAHTYSFLASHLHSIPCIPPGDGIAQ
jgi:hypothetical protein